MSETHFDPDHIHSIRGHAWYEKQAKSGNRDRSERCGFLFSLIWLCYCAKMSPLPSDGEPEVIISRVIHLECHHVSRRSLLKILGLDRQSKQGRENAVSKEGCLKFCQILFL